MERRLLLTVYTVTNNQDSLSEPEFGSLRDVINQIEDGDDDSPSDVIDFDIGIEISGAGTQPQTQTIVLQGPLPPLTVPVTIDGTTQPGYAGVPLIAIDGNNTVAEVDADLEFGPGSDGSVVQGLALVNSAGAGVLIASAGNVTLLSNEIGVLPVQGNATGDLDPNHGYGVALSRSVGDTIGGPGVGNVIAGNEMGGISVTLGSSNETIQGNFIGALQIPDSEIGLGNGNFGNLGDGITLDVSTANTIGGTAAGDGNLISGNSGNGLDISSGSSNLVQGNTIGLSFAGSTTVPNQLDGVLVANSKGNTIGGSFAAASNVISGNSGDGIGVLQGSSANLIQGDNIGVDATGQNFFGNLSNGVEVQASTGNTISGDVISANDFAGVLLDRMASGNLVVGSLIGTDAEGDQLANLSDGVFIIQSPDNTVGGTTAAARNVLSANQGYGISFRGPMSTGDVALGNYIGLDATGESNLGNLLGGIFVQNAPANTIGGSVAGSGNVISTNGLGINIQTVANADLGQESDDFQGGFADDNVVQRNLIGTDATGLQGFGNNQEGILILGGSDNLIGGSAFGQGNVISANLSNGVDVEAEPSVAPTSGNVIQGNVIGLNAQGTASLGNGRDGIHLFDVPLTLIGGSTPGAGNIISGNTNGIEVFAPGGVSAPLDDAIQGNIIGLGANGNQLDAIGGTGLSLHNTGDGIDVEQGASGILIGGSVPGSGNIISGNGSSGIHFESQSTADAVEGNIIGLAGDGLTARANNQSGIFIAEASSAITIGGTVAGSGNVISGNATGVTITNAGSSRNVVEGNILGLGFDGSTVVGNLGFGVLLLTGVTGNTIGGTSLQDRNIISGNGQGVGIVGPGSTGNLVAGNVIGLDSSGEEARGNLQLGVFLNGASGNTIGGTTAGSGNVVSGNTGVGVEVFGPGSAGNLLEGNVIGLDATGSRSVGLDGSTLGNNSFGIQVQDAPTNSIGGTTAGARNTISGNRQAGIAVSGSGSALTLIQGNFVGTDATGTVAQGNAADGILIDNAPVVVIGGYGSAALNVISGNTNNGVDVAGSGSVFDQILGNFIGTDVSGIFGLGNGQSGVLINAAPGVVVGGTVAPIGNIIAGNGGNGVEVTGSASTGSRILGNLIGLDITGRIPVGNEADGVLLASTSGVTIGGLAGGSANVISANASSGVEFSGSATSGDFLEGNLIGTDSTGTIGLGNQTGVLVNGARQDEIGGTAPGSGNLISGNASFGIHLIGIGASNNAVQGNRIGTDLSGSVPVANPAGVFLDGAPSNLLSNNILSGNNSAGVIIQGTTASGNLLEGNLIGVDATGSRVVGSSGSQQSGVLIIDAPSNGIGGLDPSARNVISGNVAGVDISGFNAQGNVLLGNYIGTDATGEKAVPNQSGIYINGSPSNTIGGSVPLSGNLISGNTATGVQIYGTLASANVVQGNVIGTDITGKVALGNGTGVYIELAPSNTIGGPTKAAGNLISSNAVAGVYLFDDASGNLVQDNRIGVSVAGRALGNGQYGVLLYNAADNTVDMTAATGNLIANSGIGNFREFTGALPTTSTTTTSTSTSTKKSTKSKAKAVVVKAAHPVGPKVASKGVSPRG